MSEGRLGVINSPGNGLGRFSGAALFRKRRPTSLRPHLPGRWLLAVTISLLLHLIAYSQLTTLKSSPVRKPPASEPTMLSFRLAPPPPAPRQEVVPEPKPEPPPPPKPAPQAKPQPRPEPMPTPMPEPVRREAVVEPQPPPKPVELLPEHPQPIMNSVAHPPPAEPDLEEIRRQYLADLLRHIEQHKFYPLAARRRGVEGTVQISLRLLADGSIDGLEIGGDHRLLLSAANDAVRSAQPLPEPPAGIVGPLQVQYGMEFRIERR